MKLYAFIHPFGGNVLNLDKMRVRLQNLREAHPEMAIFAPLDSVFYQDTLTAHTIINEWCKTFIERCDGVIYPPEAMNSDGCRVELERAESLGKEIVPLNQLISE